MLVPALLTWSGELSCLLFVPTDPAPFLAPTQQPAPPPLVPHWLWQPAVPVIADPGDVELPVGPDPLRDNMFQQQEWDDGDAAEAGGYGHYVLDDEDIDAEAEPAADPILGHVPPAGKRVLG